MCNVMGTGKTKVCAMLWVQVKLRYVQLCNVMDTGKTKVCAMLWIQVKLRYVQCYGYR